MASSQDAGSLEESSDQNSNDFTLNEVGELILSARGGVRATSSPAILELSKDDSRYQDNDSPAVLSRNPLARSCPHRLSETTPLNSTHESSESYQDNDEEEMYERRSYCTDFFNGCLDAIVEFRNSKLIHVIQLMILPLPMSAIVMGVMYADRCPYLPIFSAIIGLVGVIFIGLWITMTFCQQRGTPCLDHQKFIIGFIFLTLVFLVAIDMSILCYMSPSFTEGDKGYCHREFYEYSIKKQIFTAVAFALVALFYLPRSSNCLCCCSCCYSQALLPNAQYHSILTIESR